MKLKAALLGCTLLAAPVAAQGQVYFDPEDSFAIENAQTPLHHRDYLPTCKSIEKIISPGFVFYPGSAEFKADMSHWANSSSRVATCSVRPGKAGEVGKILLELDLSRTPFAIRCSGHTGNPGFSSTRGVQISMIRFNEIVLSKDEKTVEVGAGLTWTSVHQYLVPKGLNVVGGRIDGVGLAGFTLGGGYSWKTNQYGLTIDTVTAFELVLPNGSVKTVTDKDKDLWFALKGGLNNYGIVTTFTFETHKQTNVWGAVLAFAGEQLEPAYKAFADFTSKDNDRMGAQLGAMAYSNGTLVLGIVLFYDGPKPPARLYDHLLDLPNIAKSIIEGSFLDFLTSIPPPVRDRASFDGIPFLHYSEPVLKATADNLQSWGDRIKEKDEGTLIVLNLDAFEKDIFTHGGPSAYPPDRSHTILPSSLYFGWTNETLDEYMGANLRALSAELIQAGIEDGQDVKHASHYTNYALFGTPLRQMYGKNVHRLREIRKQYDPHRVMDLTGGFKFRF